MALNLSNRYPGRFNAPTTAYPQGSFKNRTTPTAKDGSYLEQDWANDKEGFFQRLLAQAGLTANGNVDTATASQYYDALVSVVAASAAGRFLKFTVIDASTTYVASPAAKKLEVEIVGGGGAGGGTIAIASGQYALGGGGGAGGYCHAVVDVTSAMQTTGVTVTIGAGGVPTNNIGGAGGSSSFGTFATALGGSGGARATASSSTSFNGLPGGGGYSSGGNLPSMQGENGGFGYNSAGNTLSGFGGRSSLGYGGSAVGLTAGTGNAGASGYRGGGGGGAASASTSTAYNGGAGGAGCCIVWEYS